MQLFIPLTEEKYGRLRPFERIFSAPYTRFKCLCDCGNIVIAFKHNLINGTMVSCGCYRNEFIKNLKLAHGHGNRKNKTYRAWKGMKTRCSNSKVRSYPEYGGRGITVCERWLKFENFLADMGECPPGLTLERKNTNLSYAPETCRWATNLEQQNNKQNTVWLSFNNERLSLSEWARRLNVKRSTLANRKRLGWSDERTLMAPIGRRTVK